MATAFELTRPIAPRFVINSGIPIPSSRKGSGTGSIYPFAHLSIGDSFDVLVAAAKKLDGTPIKAGPLQGRLVNCARLFGGKHNPTAKFVTRNVESGTIIRVWRVA